MLHRMRGGVTGPSVVAWEHALYSPTHNTRPSGGAGAGNLLVAQQTGLAPADAPALNTNTASRNAPVTYNFRNHRLIRNWVRSFKLVPGTLKAALPLTYVLPRSTALRSLGGLSNSFANESFMDELARKANADPLAFRLAHSSDPRAIAVLRAVADKAGWGGPLPAQPVGFAIGRGIAFLRYETVEAYVATVAEVVVNKSTGEVRVQRVVVAHDCGQVINPDGLRHQIEGNVIQGVSRTLKEQVDYAGDNIRNNGWADYAPFFQIGYPVIQFDEVPAIEIVLLDRPEEVPWGAGEPVIGSLPGAIGNAIFNAVGARVRTLPMRPATVLAAL
jgi:CO/xanthine dehydrogenase Mo-binding subunit